MIEYILIGTLGVYTLGIIITGIVIYFDTKEQRKAIQKQNQYYADNNIPMYCDPYE